MRPVVSDCNMQACVHRVSLLGCLRSEVVDICAIRDLGLHPWGSRRRQEAYLWESALGEHAAENVSIVDGEQRHFELGATEGDEYLHQQTSLTTGTITNNNELATDFRHFR